MGGCYGSQRIYSRIFSRGSVVVHEIEEIQEKETTKESTETAAINQQELGVETRIVIFLMNL